jgi:hypothetical protein
VMVGVTEEAREHLHHAAEQPAGRFGLRVRAGDVRAVPGEPAVRRDDPELLLRSEDVCMVV